MSLDVYGFGGAPKSPEPAPQLPEAAPAASVAPAPPQAPPDASVQPAAQPQATPSAPAASTPIVAFGRQFSTPQELEGYTRHMVKSAEGRFKAQIDELKAVVPQAPPPAASPTPEPEPEGAYDVKTYSLIEKQYGQEAAEQYRSLAIAEFQRKVVDEALSRRLAPFEETEEQRRLEGQATALFARAIAATGPNGQPLIPELKVQAAAEAIVQIWQRLPPEFAMTPEGVWQAAMVYRGAMGSFVTSPPPPVPPPSGVSIDASHAVTPGFVPGQQRPSTIPRPSMVNPVTGERQVIR